MKVLLTMNLPITRVHGGANKSNRVLATQFAHAGIETVCVTPSLSVPSDITNDELRIQLGKENIHVQDLHEKFVFNYHGVVVHAAKIPETLTDVLKDTIRHFWPDWILVSSEDPSQTLLRAALEVCPDRIIFLAHTKYMMPFGPLSFYPGDKRTEMIKRAKSIITISNFNAKYVESHLGIKPFVNHPPHFGGSNFKQLGAINNEYILMVNPCAVKGIDILLGIVKAMPEKKFAVVPGWGTTTTDNKKLRELPNVYFWENTPDLDKLFDNVSILLMPSIWVEGFGMIVVDALARGIPVISSKHGGLLESKLGTNFQIEVDSSIEFLNTFDENDFPECIIPPQNISHWVDAIDLLLSNEEIYNEESELSRKRATEFISSLSVMPLIHHLEHLLEQRLVSDFRSEVGSISSQTRSEIYKRLQHTTGDETTSNEQTEEELSRSFELTGSQKQILLVNEISKTFPGYVIGRSFEINFEVDIDNLNAALEYLVARHESLRTKFVKVHGEYKQVILDSFECSAEVFERQEDEPVQDFISKNLEELFGYTYDLARPPLFKIRVLKVDISRILIAFSIHHIISDTASIDVFINELVKIYEGLVQKKKISLPQLNFQYKDFVAAQTRYLNGEEGKKSLHYWKEKIGTDIPVLDLDTDFVRPVIKTFEGASVSLRLSASVTELKYFHEREGCSTFMVLLSLVKIFLYKYTGQTQIIIGVPVSGRSEQSVRNQIGLYVNMLPMMSEIDETKSFANFLLSVKKICIEAYLNGKVPFSEIINETVTTRDPSRAPLFDVMAAMNYSDYASISDIRSYLVGDHEKVANVSKMGSSHDLAFLFSESSDGVFLELVFNKNLFKKKTIQRMISHFKNIYDTAVHDPFVKINAIEMLGPGEIQHLLQVNDNSRVRYPDLWVLHQRFEAVVQKFPNNLACKSSVKSLTYDELNQQSNRLAFELRKRGVTKDDIVPVISGRSVDIVIAIVAVLKSGACYLPIDSSTPWERIDQILKTIDYPIVMAPDDVRQQFPALSKTNLLWVNSPSLSSNPVENLNNISTPDDLAYIIYTSGSTGNPKGVMIRHRSVIRLFFSDVPLFDFSELDVWSVFHSFAFDYSVWEVFGGLLFGGSIVLLDLDVVRDYRQLLYQLKKDRVTVFSQVPGVFYNVIEYGGIEEIEALSLRYIIFAGDKLVPPKLRQWKDRFPEIRLINMYGITETTVHSTFKELFDTDLLSEKSNVGVPIPTLSIYIMDKHQKLLPHGVTGEICVGGPGVAVGYLNDEAMTLQKFVANPYRPTERIYRSGDLARLLPNNEIEYIGRKDRQVKIRGYRIELDDIAFWIRQYPLIEDVFVNVFHNASNEANVVAYVVLSPGRDLNISELKSFLTTTIPGYMIPSFFKVLSRLPLTPNGKVDKNALPPPFDEEFGNLKEDFTNHEMAVFNVWKQMLGNDNISKGDDFFNIGGHSLKAVSMLAELYKTLGVEIRLGDFFENSTIRDLAILIDEATASVKRPNDEDIIEIML